MAIALAGEVSADVRESYLIEESGRPKSFEVSKDEIRRGKRFETISKRNSAKEIGQHLQNLKKSTGEEGEIVLYETGKSKNRFTRRVVTKKLLIQFSKKIQIDPSAFASANGLKFSKQMYGYHIFEAAGSVQLLEIFEKLKGQSGIDSIQPLLARERNKRFAPNDTYFGQQWHLQNTGQEGGTAGIDLNVTPVWDTYGGTGINIGILDDGLQTSHPDLVANVDTTIDYDFNDGDANPTPDSLESHGTECAGAAAARGNNSAGVSGVAYLAKLVGLRILAGPLTDLEEAEALSFRKDLIHIKSNSWGPYEDGQTMEEPGPLARAAIIDSVKTGRGGLGTIFVWAGGNGLEYLDNSNKDGYANSIYAIAVGAVDHHGNQTEYGEPGANLLCVAPSGNASPTEASAHNITTTDLTGTSGSNPSSGVSDMSDRAYTKHFSGTSAATPMVSGVVALMLEANPNLTWRDVQEILIRTSTMNSPGDADWIANGAGFHFNHKFGAGLVNAEQAVNRALSWGNLPAQMSVSNEQKELALAIPDDSTPLTRTLNFNPLIRVEHVTVTVDISHTYRGDLAVTLIAPSGVQSRLIDKSNDPSADITKWKFMTVRHWGESSGGEWKVQIQDKGAGDTGILHSVKVEIFGSALGPVIAPDGVVLTAEGNTPANGAIDPGERVSVNLQVKNIGTTTAAALTATLEATGGITLPSAAQDMGGVGPGGVLNIPFTFTAQGSLGSWITATLKLQDGAVDLGMITYHLQLGQISSPSFSQSVGINIRDKNTADPYPSTIDVSGISGKVTKLTVSLKNFTHAFPADVDVLLVGPQGQQIILMSDAGFDVPVSDLNLTFDDDAESAVPGWYLSSTSYRPTNYGFGDSFPSAPAGVSVDRLSGFAGIDPNGQWTLYVVDDSTGDVGSIGEWSLKFDVATAVENVFFSSANYEHSEGGGNLVISVTRTGGMQGPAAVLYATTGLTAITSEDYTDVSGDLQFAVGETTKTITIPILNDGNYEGDETLYITLMSPTGSATLGTPSVANITIKDLDTDGDGLPDDWETTYGLNPGLLADGSGDADNDGFNNIQEFVARTNPSVGTSRLQVTKVEPIGADMRLNFPSVVGVMYKIEYRDDLKTGSWTTLFDNIPGTGGLIQQTDTTLGTSKKRFYRLSVIP